MDVTAEHKIENEVEYFNKSIKQLDLTQFL